MFAHFKFKMKIPLQHLKILDYNLVGISKLAILKFQFLSRELTNFCKDKRHFTQVAFVTLHFSKINFSFRLQKCFNNYV